MNDEEQLADLVAAALERLDRGQSLNLETLCAERKDLLHAVAATLGLREELPGLQRADRSIDHLRGRVLAERYRLEEPIGRGAAGTVFRAHDLRLQRDVAVKLLHQGLFGGAEIEARFRREAEVLAHHEHPHIVRIHDQGCAADGSSFLVTELLRGNSLHAVLEASRTAMPQGASNLGFANTDWLRKMLPAARLEHSYLRQVVQWILELADGLAAAHARGVFHRDVKPSNVFVRDDGTAVLLDFGIAVRSGDASMTLPHAVVGTPCYMAPEQADGRAEPHATIDVYGLTATFYHLLTLHPPHTGDVQTVLAAVRSADPTPAAKLHDGLPRDLQAILEHGLERRPQDRYPDMQALGRDLHAFLDHRPVSVRPLGAIGRTLRACRRQPSRTLASVLAIGTVILIAIVLPLLATVEASAASRERAELLAHLPADLCIEGQPGERLLVPLTERHVVLDELDRLLALDGEDLMVLLLRAAEHFDAKEYALASEDFERLEKLADSEYLRVVATRYAAAAAAGSTSTEVNLDDLPEPKQRTDHFVAGFHAMRVHDFEGAYQQLTECVDFVPARDLRLLAMCGRRRPEPEALLAEAGWLEGHYGRQTARTRHALSVAMILLRRYDAAITYCEDSLRLRPDRHGPWNNLGLAYLRSGNLEAARRCYEKAVLLRPWFPHSLSGLSQTLRQLGLVEEARQTAMRIEDTAWREHELGNLAVTMSVGAAARAEDAARRTLAAEAVEHYRAAAVVPATATRDPRYAGLASAEAYATTLADADPAQATLAFLRQLHRDPSNAQQLANLAGLLHRQSIDDASRDELRLLLLEIATSLAPGDARLVQGRDALRQELRASPR
jgi:tetratricopeptide (TPR) repeat protein